MENTISHINLYSYNTRGSGETKFKFINDIIEIPQRGTPVSVSRNIFSLETISINYLNTSRIMQF